MPFGYPVMLELSARRCVVIGATAVREGKVEGLLAAGASDVRVVATHPTERLDALERLEGVQVERRPWETRDLNGAFLCVASSEDQGVRDAIAVEARCRDVLVNVMDDIPNCDWSAPSVVRRGALIIAVATGGASPSLAKALRIELSARFGEEWSEVLVVLGEVRARTIASLPDLAERARRWDEALDLEEAAALVRAGRADELRDRLTSRLLGEEVQA